ncbi:MAG: hypothetical protein JWN03_1045 [Nocardia sp.]|nr:hypothetical protein [Nocardia sp.]
MRIYLVNLMQTVIRFTFWATMPLGSAGGNEERLATAMKYGGSEPFS